MPKEPRRSAPTMGLITAEPLQTTTKRLKFATKVTTLGKTDKQAAAAQAEKRQKKKKKNEAYGSDGTASGMVFNKGHGQHILKNPLVIAAIVEKAAIKSTDIVLEIGPGTGNLTEKLLHAAKKVIAFEIDPRMVAELSKRFQNTPLQHKLEIIKGNCLDYDFPYFDRCVANVPYAISSALVFKLLKNPSFKCAVLMFQREFALRVCAQPGSEAYCRLSVNSQLLAKCSHLMKISKNSFNPPPKVESSVIRLDPIHPPPAIDFDEWDGLVKMIFNRKNKKISSIFRTKVSLQQLYDRYCSYQAMNNSTAPAASSKTSIGNSKQLPQGPDVMTIDKFKLVLDQVLQDPILARRGRSMNQEDITQLLHLFHANGIHFI
jgi:18S rRNA (adenine1779-N6/adenine1780-N6)-dimethyltransferase